MSSRNPWQNIGGAYEGKEKCCGLQESTSRASHAQPSRKGSFAVLTIRTLLKKTLLAGCSKTLRYKAPEIPRSETYMVVRRNDSPC
jgi:hypothetical protein